MSHPAAHFSSWSWGFESRKRSYAAHNLLCGAERGLATQSADDIDATQTLGSLCDGGLPDNDVCNVIAAMPVNAPVLREAWTRGRWLLGLLVLQSMSSVVLDRYQELLKDHIVVTLFLTMLVGAGGNAGNQSSIKVIRGLVGLVF
ncbi:hypothetical protein WJX84_002663 [Apatococcus fuscideae]|uniref:Uncharacterized protein n=1 Tax=Apatococcus fuscideae TaxID=2026836 RepID=A0AAW1TDT7_9CHLO